MPVNKFATLYTEACLAWMRGHAGVTVPDGEETKLSFYHEAWMLGNDIRNRKRIAEPHMLVACGCHPCRLRRIVEKSKEMAQ